MEFAAISIRIFRFKTIIIEMRIIKIGVAVFVDLVQVVIAMIEMIARINIFF